MANEIVIGEAKEPVLIWRDPAESQVWTQTTVSLAIQHPDKDISWCALRADAIIAAGRDRAPRIAPSGGTPNVMPMPKSAQ